MLSKKALNLIRHVFTSEKLAFPASVADQIVEIRDWLANHPGLKDVAPTNGNETRPSAAQRRRANRLAAAPEPE